MPAKNNARKSIFKKSIELENLEECKGYDFERGLDFEKFLNSLYYTGFQATNLGKAIRIAKKMRSEKARIFFGFTSNVISSGLREQVTFLTKQKMIDVIVTTVGGVEEDIIKTHKPFLLGDFKAEGKELRKKGINRTGNLFIPNERYIWFEKFMQPLFKRLLEEQKKNEKIINAVNFVKECGRELESYPNKENSYIYWAFKNNIPVFCPGLTDGSLGDMLYFFKKECPEFKIDIADDIVTMNDLALNAEKTGAIIIGGSLPKHHIMNANMFREGADYTIYINTAIEEDGSNAGARPDEAKSWGKAANENDVKVWGEATIVFPLLVAGAFVEKKD